jgi:hypothetical protein
MKLYHFTSARHAAQITEDGYITTTESNLSARREHAGPDVVWLTSNPSPASHTWWHVPPGMRTEDKTAFRFTVDVPKTQAVKWKTWGARHGIDPKWAAILATAGGSSSWYVLERQIRENEWTEITDTRAVEI